VTTKENLEKMVERFNLKPDYVLDSLAKLFD
ncbi:MAG TPA: HAD family hydrolase, partial [Archaeoglobus veneficus]|nr:HAD family hydrolase [Archaeoglobus veneficus]